MGDPTGIAEEDSVFPSLLDFGVIHRITIFDQLTALVSGIFLTYGKSP